MTGQQSATVFITLSCMIPFHSTQHDWTTKCHRIHNVVMIHYTFFVLAPLTLPWLANASLNRCSRNGLLGLLTMMRHRLAMICARLHDSPMPTVRCVCVNYNCLSVIGGVCSGLSCQLGSFSSMMSKVFEWAAQEFCGPVAHWRTSKK